MAKIDFKKEWADLYHPPRDDFQVVEVPDLQFLMIDGQGDPNSAAAYQQALDALYAVAYKLKFLSKKGGRDYVVPPLEGLWWAEDMEAFTSARDKEQWVWTMMIMTPPWIAGEVYHRAVGEVREKKGPPALDKIRLEDFTEGLAVQILHVGPYEEEGPVLERLHQRWMPEEGYGPNGKHHEIYLSDPRRTAPEKLKTILRQPIRPV